MDSPTSSADVLASGPAAPNLNEQMRYVYVHLEFNSLRSLAAKQVQIGLAADSVSAAISDAACKSQRLERLQKQIGRLQHLHGSEFKSGTPQFCFAAEGLCGRQVHALQLQVNDAVADLGCLKNARADHGGSVKISRGTQQKVSKNARSLNKALGSCRAGQSTATAAKQNVWPGLTCAVNVSSETMFKVKRNVGEVHKVLYILLYS